MYLSHFGLNEPPFRITPHTEFFFSGANRGATLEALLYAISHDEGIVKVTGEVGSGKTMLCRVLVERLPKTVETIYLANPSLSRDEILHVIAADLQVESHGERLTILLRALQERLIKLYASGRRVVVLIDEAHAMPLETLEEVRLLSNLESNRHKLLQIVLFGQPELDETLALPNMRQLKERITHSFRLEPLVRSDIESYIDFRMRAAGYRGPSVFGPQAMRLITRASEGLTRRVNILADKSLLAAFAAGTHEVTAQHVRAAIRDAEYGPRGWGAAKWWLVAGGIAAAVAIGFGIHLGYRANSAAAAGAMSGASSSPVVASAAAPVAATEAAAETAKDGTATVSAVPLVAPAEPPAPSSAASGTVPDSPAAATTVATVARAPTQAVATAETVSDQAPVPPTEGKLLRERFDATQGWLKTAPRGTWTIQLLTVSADQAQTMEQFLEHAAKLVSLDELYVYSIKVDGEQYYGVTYGNYPNLEETITAMGGLPSSFKARGPFHRSITVMRRQNRE
jgi:type II secretory pathway predicted ATPase ExeA/septal ring-binding cell division protein DamX